MFEECLLLHTLQHDQVWKHCEMLKSYWHSSEDNAIDTWCCWPICSSLSGYLDVHVRQTRAKHVVPRDSHLESEE